MQSLSNIIRCGRLCGFSQLASNRSKINVVESEVKPAAIGPKIRRINELNTRKPGESVGVQGWVENVRRMKTNIFLDVSDGSTADKFQVVVPKSDETKKLSPGNSIRAMGIIQVAPRGNYELHADKISLVGTSSLSDGYPFVPKQNHPPDYVREYLHLRSRIGYVASQFRVRHRATKAIHDFMDRNGLIHIDTPILTTNDCEGAGEIFTVKPGNDELLKEMRREGVALDESYFDQKVFLSVSGQLHLEAATYGLGSTYTISPAFRAENCKSPLHLSEFYMVEAELAFTDSMDDLKCFIEQFVKQITEDILSHSSRDLKFCQENANAPTDFSWLEKEWISLSYDEAYSILKANKSKLKTELKENEGFSKDQELTLVGIYKAPVFIINWPSKAKPFYMREVESDNSKVQALDLLMPTVGELCGGSLRETNYNQLVSKSPPGLQWYAELRKFGGTPTAGFGLGFERYLQLITGVKNIRDVIPYPRYPHSCKM